VKDITPLINGILKFTNKSIPQTFLFNSIDELIKKEFYLTSSRTSKVVIFNSFLYLEVSPLNRFNLVNKSFSNKDFVSFPLYEEKNTKYLQYFFQSLFGTLTKPLPLLRIEFDYNTQNKKGIIEKFVINKPVLQRMLSH
jgi:hypothetical protein